MFDKDVPDKTDQVQVYRLGCDRFKNGGDKFGTLHIRSAGDSAFLAILQFSSRDDAKAAPLQPVIILTYETSGLVIFLEYMDAVSGALIPLPDPDLMFHDLKPCSLVEPLCL